MKSKQQVTTIRIFIERIFEKDGQTDYSAKLTETDLAFLIWGLPLQLLKLVEFWHYEAILSRIYSFLVIFNYGFEQRQKGVDGDDQPYDFVDSQIRVMSVFHTSRNPMKKFGDE